MTRVKEQTIGDYLQALASTAAVPGGGSAAALAAAMGAALVSMVAKLSAKKARTDEIRAALTGLVPELDQLAERLVELSQDDIDAYRAVIDGRSLVPRLPRSSGPMNGRPRCRWRPRRRPRVGLRWPRKRARTPGT